MCLVLSRLNCLVHPHLGERGYIFSFSLFHVVDFVWYCIKTTSVPLVRKQKHQSELCGWSFKDRKIWIIAVHSANLFDEMGKVNCFKWPVTFIIFSLQYFLCNIKFIQYNHPKCTVGSRYNRALLIQKKIDFTMQCSAVCFVTVFYLFFDGLLKYKYWGQNTISSYLCRTVVSFVMCRNSY